jgi:hypothetical protein
LIVMAASMAAMMVPTAAPFFFAYGRDTRRPAAVVITLLIHVADWAAIGAIADFAMGQSDDAIFSGRGRGRGRGRIRGCLDSQPLESPRPRGLSRDVHAAAPRCRPTRRTA